MWCHVRAVVARTTMISTTTRGTRSGPAYEEAAGNLLRWVAEQEPPQQLVQMISPAAGAQLLFARWNPERARFEHCTWQNGATGTQMSSASTPIMERARVRPYVWDFRQPIALRPLEELLQAQPAATVYGEVLRFQAPRREWVKDKAQWTEVMRLHKTRAGDDVMPAALAASVRRMLRARGCLIVEPNPFCNRRGEVVRILFRNDGDSDDEVRVACCQQHRRRRSAARATSWPPGARPRVARRFEDMRVELRLTRDVHPGPRSRGRRRHDRRRGGALDPAAGDRRCRRRRATPRTACARTTPRDASGARPGDVLRPGRRGPRGQLPRGGRFCMCSVAYFSLPG